MNNERIKFVLMFLHSVNAVYILVFVILPPCSVSLSLPLSPSLPASTAVSQGGSVAPGQTYASFHCTNPNAAWRNNCSSGRGFAGALSLTGSRQPGTRHFNQLCHSLSVRVCVCASAPRPLLSNQIKKQKMPFCVVIVAASLRYIGRPIFFNKDCTRHRPYHITITFW